MRKQGYRFNVSSTIDLHCHTTASDGKLTPAELIAKAQERNITTLAITDHDTLAGFREAKPYAEQAGINLISGIEVSTVWGGANIHIVGLNIDENHPTILEAETYQKKVRINRAEVIAQRLGKRLNHEIDMDEIRSYTQDGQIGRPHFAQYLLKHELISTFAEAFNKYLGAGKIGDVKTGWPDIPTAVQWITEAGGIAVFAHGHHYKMTRTKLLACVSDFVEAGGRAIEVAYGLMDNSQQQKMVRIAEDFDLLGSCGSDYHGPNRFGLELGTMTAFPEGITPVWETF